MHFHLPKPLHGWRELAGEVGIIVVGVLIALAAEQLVEEWTWHRKAEAARASIMHELALDAGVFDERAINAKCVEANGAELAAVLRKVAKTGVLPNLDHVGGGSTRPAVTGAWVAATADGTVSHLSNDFREILGIEYPLIADYPNKLMEENQQWAIVRLAQQAPGPISETLLAEVATALARARYEARINDVVAAQALEVLEKAGVKPDYSFPLDAGASRADLIRAIKTYGCKPLLVDGRQSPPA